MTKNPDNYIQCDRNVNCMFVYSNCLSIYHLLLQHVPKITQIGYTIQIWVPNIYTQNILFYLKSLILEICAFFIVFNSSVFNGFRVLL